MKIIKKIRRKGNNRKSVQIDFSPMSLLKLKKPFSPSHYNVKKPAINNINIYITKNKDDKQGSVYSSVKSSEDESEKEKENFVLYPYRLNNIMLIM